MRTLGEQGRAQDPCLVGRAVRGGSGTPERRSMAGWSGGSGGERVKGRFLDTCEAGSEATMWPSGIRGRERRALGAPEGQGGPGLALQLPWLPPRSPVGEGVLLSRRKAYSQVMTWYSLSVGTTCRSAEVSTVAEP